MIDLVFNLALALLLTHEIDAVRAREWRLLFVLRTLPERRAGTLFIALHVPLVAAVLWLVNHPDPVWELRSRAALAVLLIIHAGLHWRLRHRPEYDFHSVTSRLLIHGGALAGVVYLLLVWGRLI